MIRRTLLGAVLGAALAVQPALALGPPRPLQPAASPESVGFDAERLKRVDAYMAKVVADGRVAGMSTLLARHGRIVMDKTYGKASLASGQAVERDTIWRIYSMSKPITGVAMMILYEEGRWRLDDPVTKFVPEFKNLVMMTGTNPDGSIATAPLKRPPTMREVMSHTAGFGYGLADVHPVDKQFRTKEVLRSQGLQQMVDRVSTIPLMYEPGTRWSYSVAVDVQGYIVEKLSGMPLGRFMEERIFRPLKMNDTAFSTGAGKARRLAALYQGGADGKIAEATTLFGDRNVPDYTKPPAMESGGGGLLSTTRDYSRFCQMLLNGGELDGARILSPASVELMGTNVIPQNVLVSSNGTTGARFNEAVGFGLDFMVVNDPRRSGSLEGKGSMSWGGAAGTWFWVDPTNDLFFVGMIQRMGGTGGEDLGQQARTLTYQALTHPEK